MKTFVFKGEMAELFGSEVSLDVLTMREALMAFFSIKKGFKKYYLNKLNSGVNYVFIDSKDNILENFCSDLLLQDSQYKIIPSFEAAGGLGFLGNFGLNAAMGYGMQKLANKLNPIEETGEEYEIIETNSFLYSSNENRAEQGLPIPVVYGQLRVGSLVINSNIQNYDFDYQNLQIYKANTLVNLPIGTLKDFSHDFSSGGTTFQDKNLRGNSFTNDFGSQEPLLPYSDADKRLKPAFMKGGAKVSDASHGNESYNENYEQSDGDGGTRKVIGPSEVGNVQDFTDNGASQNGKGITTKPYVFPPEGNPDSPFRPSSPEESCISMTELSPGDTVGAWRSQAQTTNGKDMVIGKRGEYQKLESIGVYRSLDILSEGPIAGLAIPSTGRSSYDGVSPDGSFSNDNSYIALGYSGSSNLEYSKKTAQVGSLIFNEDAQDSPNDPLAHFIDSTEFNQVPSNKTNQITILNSGSGYEANFTGLITGNTRDDSYPFTINVEKPVSSKSASLSSNSSNGIFTILNASSGTLGFDFSNDEISEYQETSTITDPETSTQITVTGLNLTNLSSASNILIGEGYSPNEDILTSIQPDNAPVEIDLAIRKRQPNFNQSHAKAYDASALIGVENGMLKEVQPSFEDFYLKQPSGPFGDRSTMTQTWNKFARIYCDVNNRIANYNSISSVIIEVGMSRAYSISSGGSDYKLLKLQIEFENYLYLGRAFLLIEDSDENKWNSSTKYWDQKRSETGSLSPDWGDTFGMAQTLGGRQNVSFYRYAINGYDAGITHFEKIQLFAHLFDYAKHNGHENYIDVGLLLRERVFSERVFDLFNANTSNKLKKAELPPPPTDDTGLNYTTYIKFCPGAGSHKMNTDPTYVTNISDPNITDCQINDGGGSYNPNLVYRVQVYVIRKSSFGTSSDVSYTSCLTNIDAFASVSKDGNVNGVFVTHVPDRCVLDNLLGYTPILIKKDNNPKLANPFGEGNFSNYADVGIYLEIDSSERSQPMSIDFLNGRVNADTLNIDNSPSFTFNGGEAGKDNTWPNLIENKANNFLRVAHGLMPHFVENSGGNYHAYRDVLVQGYSSSNIKSSLGWTNGNRYAKIRLDLEVIDLNKSSNNKLESNPFASSRYDENFTPSHKIFCTGRIKSFTLEDSGGGYVDQLGNPANAQKISLNIYNDSFEISRALITSANGNLGYKPSSSIIIPIGFVYKGNEDLVPDSLSPILQHPKFNFSSIYTAELELKVDSDGSISRNREDLKINNGGYNHNFIDIPVNYGEEDFPDVTLNLKPSIPSGLSVDPTLSSGFLAANENFVGSDTWVELENISYTYYSLPEPSENWIQINGSLEPGLSFPKEPLELIVPKEDIVNGSITKIFEINQGKGFAEIPNQDNVLPDATEANLVFNASTNSQGNLSSISIDQSINASGYSLRDNDVEIKLSAPPIIVVEDPPAPSIEIDDHAWARSVYLNSTPIRDKDGRFNFSNFEFDFAGGYHQNAGINTSPLPSFPKQSSPDNPNINKNNVSKGIRSLLEKEFRLPAQTHFVNYKLYGPRNNGEKDYFYTHTLKNPEIAVIALNIKVNELHHVYEGDESIVYLNLRPLVLGLVMYLFAQKLLEKAMRTASPPDPVAIPVSGTVTVIPCSPKGVITVAVAGGVHKATLADIAETAEATFAQQIVTAGVGLFALIFGFKLGKKLPCGKGDLGGFLCIKMGEVIKNSGEIWPAKVIFSIEYGIEGYAMLKKNLKIQGCSTSPYIKDIILSISLEQLEKDYKKQYPRHANSALWNSFDRENIFSQVDDKRKRNRIIQFYRTTREMDPVNNGIADARNKLDVELASVTEYVAGFFSYPNTAMFASRINGKDMPQAPRREFLIKGKMVKIPNGYSPSNGSYGPDSSRANSFFNEEIAWTSNPAWIIYDLLTNPIYGLGKYGITDEQIDKWSFFEFARRADEAVDVFIDGIETKERRYMCNLYVDTEREAFDYIKELMNIYSSKINFSGGKIYISTDKPSDPVMLFTNANISSEGFIYSTIPQTNRVTAATVDYLDERDNYIQKTEYVEDEAGIREHGYRHIKIAGIGITRKGEANRLAMNKIMSNKIETEIISFTVGLHGGYLRIGDVIEVMDNNKVSQHSGGRVISRISDSIIEVDIPTDAITGATKIYVQNYAESTESTESDDGNRPSQYSEYNITAMNDFQITVAESLHESIKSSYVWMVKDYNDINNDTVKSSQYKIKEIIESNDSQYKITALLYDAKKYSFVDGVTYASEDDEYEGHDIDTSQIEGGES
jgi:predicted phage tail protein